MKSIDIALSTLNQRKLNQLTQNKNKMINVNFDDLVKQINSLHENILAHNHCKTEEIYQLLGSIIELANNIITEPHCSHKIVEEDAALLCKITQLVNNEVTGTDLLTIAQRDALTAQLIIETTDQAVKHRNQHQAHLQWSNLGKVTGSVFSGIGMVSIIIAIVIPAIIFPPALAATLGTLIIAGGLFLLGHSFNEDKKIYHRGEILEADIDNQSNLLRKIGLFRNPVNATVSNNNDNSAREERVAKRSSV